jgi:hypothetical protein
MYTIAFEKSVVSRMFDEAIEFCAEKSGFNGPEKARKAIGNGDCCVCEYLHYALALQVAEYLGSVDESITAIYSYEPEYATGSDSMGPGHPRTQPAMNLIARVNRKSAALSSVVASLSAAMDEELRRLGCPHANALCREMAVNLADEQEVKKRMGYGALIDSLYVRPIEVWHR